MAEQIFFSIVGTTDTVGVPCVPGSLSDSTTVSIGPLAETISMVLNVRTGHFISADSTEITVDSDFFTADNSNARPKSGKTCVFRGRTMRVITTAEDSTRAYIKVFLGSAR
jgi:hypothetical protein